MKIFKEEQRFTQLWLLVILAVSLIVPVILIVKEYIQENSTMSSIELTLTLLGILASFAFIFIFKLTTRIDEYGIHYQFFPFHLSLRKIAWSEIEKAYVRNYDPIGEYGGWGLKGGLLWNKKRGTALNISGDIGIQLKLKNGKKLLIGTKKEQEAKRVLETYEHKVQQL
ncbi:hypothetical protein [Tenacibaculum aestuarii]|uniref:hypothetical protein n=1 Tax=Tenacibaculum aestuarii TaxID=362781 RepID=UPI0038935483